MPDNRLWERYRSIQQGKIYSNYTNSLAREKWLWVTHKHREMLRVWQRKESSWMGVWWHFNPCSCPLQVFWVPQSPRIGQIRLLLLYHILFTWYPHMLLLKVGSWQTGGHWVRFHWERQREGRAEGWGPAERLAHQEDTQGHTRVHLRGHTQNVHILPTGGP